jgi:hypothetical protein
LALTVLIALPIKGGSPFDRDQYHGDRLAILEEKCTGGGIGWRVVHRAAAVDDTSD